MHALITDQKSLHKTYKLTSWAFLVGLPLGCFLFCALAFVAIGCFEPTMTIDCKSRTECSVSERTWIGERGPQAFDPATTTFDLERSGKNRHLRIKNRSDGAVVFDSNMSNAGASAAKNAFDRFIANPGVPTLNAKEGMSPFIMLFVTPLVLLLNLIPLWGMGGNLIVDARPGYIRTTRVRLGGFRNETEFRYPESETPVFSLERRGKEQTIVVRATSGEAVIARSASPNRLRLIFNDLLALYGV